MEPHNGAQQDVVHEWAAGESTERPASPRRRRAFPSALLALPLTAAVFGLGMFGLLSAKSGATVQPSASASATAATETPSSDSDAGAPKPAITGVGTDDDLDSDEGAEDDD